jgi:hypothetical protein
MCTVLLPPGVNPIVVDKYIVSYHINIFNFCQQEISLIKMRDINKNQLLFLATLKLFARQMNKTLGETALVN